MLNSYTYSSTSYKCIIHDTYHLYLQHLHLLLLLTAILLSTQTNVVTSQLQQEKQEQEANLLVEFKRSLSNAEAITNWNLSLSTPPCSNNTSNWIGLICRDNTLWGIQLENMGLTGTIDVETLAKLSGLRSVSLSNNSFSGPLPRINKIAPLKSLFLSFNNFSGVIDDDAFDGMDMLKKVYLQNNGFVGGLPTSLVGLPRLLELSVQENGFQGEIPEFKSTDLMLLNFSHNSFNGTIPAAFSRMNATSFLGNSDLCGPPLQTPCSSTDGTTTATDTDESTTNRTKKSSSHTGLIIVIVVTVVMIIFISLAFLIKRNRQQKQLMLETGGHPSETRQLQPSKAPKAGPNNTANGYNNQRNRSTDRSLERPSSYSKKGDNGKLCFLRSDRDKFEMQDLLKASAEVLGSGSFGSSYKATLVSGPSMVVKRFRQMNNVGREEFHEHIKRLGILQHPNLLPLVAFFYKREEKLLITEFVEDGSLASHLHSKRTAEQPGLTWPVRLRIIKGVARGLAYLYRELPHLPLPHGHLKSSNVLLGNNFEPLLSDYALAPVINKEHAEQTMVAYKSPEFFQENCTSKKTDVWCLGILILEILTGKFPANYLKHGRGASDDLVAWVDSVVRGEWSSEVFDGDMGDRINSYGEMMKLLRIGMWCCEWNVEKRWDLKETVQKIEELRERDRDEDNYNMRSLGNEAEIYSSTRGSISEERLSFR